MAYITDRLNQNLVDMEDAFIFGLAIGALQAIFANQQPKVSTKLRV